MTTNGPRTRAVRLTVETRHRVLTLAWEDRTDDPPLPYEREGSADALVDRADPHAPPPPFGFRSEENR